MDKIIQIIAICFLKSTTKGDSLNSYEGCSPKKWKASHGTISPVLGYAAPSGLIQTLRGW